MEEETSIFAQQVLPLAIVKERQVNRSVCLEIKNLKTQYLTAKSHFDQLCQQKILQEEKTNLLQDKLDDIKKRSYTFTQFFSNLDWKTMDHSQIMEKLTQELEKRKALIEKIENHKEEIEKLERGICAKKNTIVRMLELINKAKELKSE